MATWKNPFKFTTTKPTLDELIDKLTSTYTTPIEGILPIDQMTSIVIYLSTVPWEKGKQAFLEEKSYTNAVKYVLNNSIGVLRKALTQYNPLLPNPDSIDNHLLIACIAYDMNLSSYETILGKDSVDKDVISILLDYENTDSFSYKVLHKEEVLSHLDRYTTSTASFSHTVYDKKELSEHVFENLLVDNTLLPNYKLEKEDTDDIPF